ncbi:hypothetical protein FKM82_016926 [Ascaphus truei]
MQMMLCFRCLLYPDSIVSSDAAYNGATLLPSTGIRMGLDIILVTQSGSWNKAALNCCLPPLSFPRRGSVRWVT